MADKHVYETSKLKIKVKLQQRSRKNNDTAQLVITVDGVPQDPIDLAVNKQWVEHPHTFEEVPDAKDNYTLSYRISHDTESLDSDHYTVWPLTAKVKLINHADKTALPRMSFDLAFDNDQVSHFRTGDDGTCNCNLKQKALFSIGPTRDVIFAGWETGRAHGRDRVAKMQVMKLKAVVETPAWWQNTTVEQVVNRPTTGVGATVGHDSNGPKVTFNLKLVDALDPARAIGTVVGHDVYVKATFTDLTKRNAKLPDLLDVKDLDRSVPGVLTAKVETSRAGKASFTLQLGVGGREKCKLQLGTTPECKDYEVKFTNKRSIWLQTIGRAGAAPSLSAATAAFDKVGITMLRDDDVVLDVNNTPAGALVAGAVLGRPTEVSVVGNHNIGLFQPLFANQHAPLSAFAIFSDFQFDAGRTGPRTANFNVDVAPGTTVKFAGGAAVAGTFAYPVGREGSTTNRQIADEATLLSVSLRDGSCPVRGTWTSKATTGTHLGATGPIPDDHFHIDWAKASGKLQIKMPPGACAVLNDGESVAIALVVTYVQGPYAGWAPAGGVVIPLRADSAHSVKEMNGTVVHELGHLLNMVRAPRAGVDLTLGADHKWHYTDRGHTGGHCAFGVSKKFYDSGDEFDGAMGAKCVMYGEEAGNTDFCTKCKPFCLAEAVESF